ncbi:hypothetical protein Bca101_099011 [Brassica carinata]
MANNVTSWREALTQIACIAGKDSAACEDEVSMIEEIVEDISNQLLIMQPVKLSNIVGMNIHMERLNHLLSMESEGEVSFNYTRSLHEKKKFRGAELGPHEVKVFAQDTSWFGPGSRTVYEVKCLDTDDSRKIFNQLAFEGGLPPSECYDKLSIRASRLAEGLPCAIKAYGLFF